MKFFIILNSVFLLFCFTSQHNSTHVDLLPKMEADLKPGESTVVTFSSVSGNKGREKLTLWFEQAGDYTLTLSNANPAYSGHWLYWDYLDLKDGNTKIWAIGEDETPPDYSTAAFDEWCEGDNCKKEWVAGSQSRNFQREMNDGSITEITITFEIEAKYARKSLTLDLSTLFSSHSDIPDYRMRIGLD